MFECLATLKNMLAKLFSVFCIDSNGARPRTSRGRNECFRAHVYRVDVDVVALAQTSRKVFDLQKNSYDGSKRSWENQK